MRVLIISRSPWRKDNSFGNTYSNIFGNMNNIQIANIYLADGNPDIDNSNVTEYYRISEKEVAKSILRRSDCCKKIGERVVIGGSIDDTNSSNEIYDKTLNGMKKKRWSLFYIIRELVWKFGNINLDDMMEFVLSFNPDIIFLPFYYARYVDRIALYIKQNKDIPLVLEASIDIYSLRQISFDPFYWINRFSVRFMVRATIAKAEKLYVISDKMKRDYQKLLKIPCDVLYKFPDLNRKQTDYKFHDNKLQFLYSGNIGTGRWTSLAELGKAVHECNLGKVVIYTPTPITKKMKKGLRFCELHPAVSSDEILKLQNEADVLVHAESFRIKDSLEARYSISTKVMDYISVCRCIVAIGPPKLASIEFLAKNDVAIVISNKSEIKKTIRYLAEHRDLVEQYVNKSSNYIINKSLERSPQDLLYDDLKNIIINYKHNVISN